MDVIDFIICIIDTCVPGFNKLCEINLCFIYLIDTQNNFLLLSRRYELSLGVIVTVSDELNLHT